MAWSVPETRASILLRVHDPNDHEAWSLFASIYRSAIYRAARSFGLQHADADDIAQVVLGRVSEREWKFTPDSEGAKFRTWLARITRNAVVDLHRKRQRMGTAEFPVTETSICEDSLGQHLELDYRREVFHWAAGVVRPEFSRDAWESFWLTAVENQSVNDVAQRLNRTVGSIYTSRSRIMRRLKEQVSRFDERLEDEL